MPPSALNQAAAGEGQIIGPQAGSDIGHAGAVRLHQPVIQLHDDLPGLNPPDLHIRYPIDAQQFWLYYMLGDITQLALSPLPGQAEIKDGQVCGLPAPDTNGADVGGEPISDLVDPVPDLHHHQIHIGAQLELHPYPGAVARGGGGNSLQIGQAPHHTLHGQGDQFFHFPGRGGLIGDKDRQAGMGDFGQKEQGQSPKGKDTQEADCSDQNDRNKRLFYGIFGYIHPAHLLLSKAA